MATLSGTVDILALAKDAFQLYHIYRGAQDRYRALSEDIIGLESTLKVLGNKLVFQGTGGSSSSSPAARQNLKVSDAAQDGSGGGLDIEETAALQHLIHQSQKLLQELHARVPATKVPRGLYRLKWSESEVLSIRSRITALNSSIAAFSSSLVVSHVSFSARTEHSQQQILSTLREVLNAVQNGKDSRPPSHADSPAARIDDSGVPPDEAFLQNLVHGMRRHGVSDVHLDEHGELVVRSVSPGPNVTFGYKPEKSSEANKGKAWDGGAVTYEVLSAVWGPRVLTKRIQRMLDSHIATKSGPMEFVIQNEIMGGDPLFGHRKSFVMVWRKLAVYDGRILHSEPQCVSGEEDDRITLFLDAPLPCAEQQQRADSPVSPPEGTTQIVLASWFDVDVTARVATLVASGQTSIMATSDNLHAADPKLGHVKTLSVCWTYAHGPGAALPSVTEFQTATALDGQHLDVPPRLSILCARKGDLDITDLLQAMVTGHQTLTIDTSDTVLAILDPRPGLEKTISVVYQYGSRVAQLAVVGGEECMVELTPHTLSGRYDDDCVCIFDLDASEEVPIGENGSGQADAVLAVVWGLQPLPLETTSLREALQRRLLPCCNEFFGFDGWYEASSLLSFSSPKIAKPP
ncbi:hypothetical protein IF1G_10583 [Cordyceps javanica]|uniref:Uncharacterized protein n=1 Tax=Cordyceps javanica TaxID=43265 RepID=A0A545VLD9_9HYPO|nr:hypothetical protein IF1G_10583 [Cordyceps javanica]TQW02476.1 hypothetical protein IF2G_10076 [Cordyceps javanica]